MEAWRSTPPLHRGGRRLPGLRKQGLLLGETADLEVVEDIRRLARSLPGVAEVGRPLTMHLGPDEVLLNLEIDFRPGLAPGQISEEVERLEREIRERHPEIRRIFIEAKALRGSSPEAEPSLAKTGSSRLS